MLTAADDRLHTPVDDDPWWTETAWFGFAVPEAGIAGSIYQIYRTAQGVMATAVYVWAPGRDDLRELPYYRTFWHLPIPEDAHPCDNELASGLSVRTQEPMTSYRLTYSDADELTLDLTWDAVMEAQPFHVSNGMGHLDQLGRVTGTMTLHGETHRIDCIEMRDRSWTPRRETSRRTRRGYTYGSSADAKDAFFVATNVPPGGGEDAIIGGWSITDGQLTPVTGGLRTVDRDDASRPIAVTVDAETADGPQRWRAEVHSRLALPTSPYFAWMSLTSWTRDDGIEGWGEDHDSWSPARWRRLRRGLET